MVRSHAGSRGAFTSIETIRGHDVEDDAISAGATTLQGVTFRVSDPKTIQTQARQVAMADARAKADALAGAAGVSVKGVASITEYTSQTTPVVASGYALDSKSASTPVQTGTTDVIISVTILVHGSFLRIDSASQASNLGSLILERCSVARVATTSSS